MFDGEQRVREDLDDRIWGIEGTYLGKEEVKGYDHPEKLYYVKYRPAVDWHRLSFWKKILLKLGVVDLVEKTPEPLPESQIQEGVPCPDAGSVTGVPPKKTVLVSDRNGDARWSDYIDEQLNREARRLQKEKNREEQERMREQLERLEKEHEGRLEEDDRFKKKGGGNAGNNGGTSASQKVNQNGR